MATVKTIAITKDNAARIEAALAAVNGRATAHAYTSFDEIQSIAEAAEKAMDAALILKKSRAGAIWHETSGIEVANSYRGVRKATAVKLIRKSGGWHFDSAHQVEIYKEGDGKGRLWLTEAQAEEAKARFAATLNVMK